ncbi:MULTISPECIES: hypothetical protein [unclassified Burkholderia]|uniref:hypothetical protein n=1 Tax=unclassified Burkholderia TaxID=2613784 RepID=UPI00075398F0|nr:MULTISPECIES: hypothetical protein [unclassified Burkholderia]KVN15826.1 hypothetical protein WT08_06850 [Burkholderia sp. MSMB1552]KWZ54532.1 hypothetical protein WS92_00515 [Burkholderia sp. MSMB1588]
MISFKRKMSTCPASRLARAGEFVLEACVAGALAGAALVAHAQSGPQPVIDWEIQVVRDGQTIDTFEQKTTVGQARSDTHSFPVAPAQGCAAAAASAADAPGSGLSRTITVAPLYVEDGAVALAIDAQETLADEGAAPSAGAPCTSAPPRRIVASHPDLNARAAQWTDWTLADRGPQLVYRVRARVVAD